MLLSQVSALVQSFGTKHKKRTHGSVWLESQFLGDSLKGQHSSIMSLHSTYPRGALICATDSRALLQFKR